MPAPDENALKASVARFYGARARPILEGDEALALSGAEETACCDDSCCSTAGVRPAATTASRLYDESQVSGLPATVTGASFGCGNPAAIAALRPGEVVLDLGSGGGIDCFIAAKAVGPEGRVYGVDMTPEMVTLARANATKVGAGNVEFRLGEIEHLPIADGSVDVVISNCVINLSPDKDQVFREAFRVLKPGGRLQVSDIVWKGSAPAHIDDSSEQWAACIAGALAEADYVARIEAAGFRGVTIAASEYPGGDGLASADVLAWKR